MKSIKAIRIGSRFLELTSEELTSLDGLFDIDSVNLLLGKNGAGKTRLLLAIAEGLISENSEAHFYYNLATNKHDMSCIYYSALPYRRKIPSRACFVDASPSLRTQNQDEMEKLNQLREVAHALGIDTRLTAVFGYTNKVYRAVLIPVLKKHESKIKDETLKNLIHLYIDSESKPIFDDTDLKIVDHKNESYLKDIEHLLSVLFTDQLGDAETLLWLGSIEYIYGTSKEDGLNASNAFLVHLGLLANSFDSNNFEKVERILERTREILSQNQFPYDFMGYEKSYKFAINGVDHLSDVKARETPIKIEWNELSSGLHALVEQFSLIGKAIAASASKRRFSVLLLIDEGDAYLHLEWQRKYFSLLNKYLGKLKKMHNLHSLQLILASHSPILAADLPGQVVSNLDIEDSQSIKNQTFAAPLEKVITQSFESSSLGEFATTKINETYHRARLSKLTDLDRVIIQSIGDIAIRTALEREIVGDN